MNSLQQSTQNTNPRKNRLSSGLSKMDIADYGGYLKILNEKVWKGLTPHDLYSLKGISKIKLYNMVLKELKLTEKSTKEEYSKALKHVQIIYNHSVHELHNTFLLPVPEGVKGVKWTNIESFVDAMYETLNDPKCGYNTIVQCALFKTMYAVKDILDNHGDMSQAGMETKIVVDAMKKLPGFHIEREDEGTHDIYFTNGLEKNHPEYIEGRINFRTKQFKSILMKLVYNRTYMTSDLLKDLIGIRVEIDDPRGTNMGDRALAYFSQLFYTCEIEEKGSFLSQDFTSDIPFQKKKNKAGTGNLREAKLVGDLLFVDNEGDRKSAIDQKIVTNKIEVQFVYTGNKNESGFNKHEIYDLKKVLSAACRLMGSLTVSNIKVAVKETLRLLGDTGSGKKEKLNQLNEQSILLHLLYSKDEHGFLIPIRVNGDLRFLTKDIYVESFQELYKNYPKFETLDEIEFNRLYRLAKVPTIKVGVTQ